MAEVDRKELADKQEAAAEEIAKGGKPEDLGVVEILTRVMTPDQLPVFYSGGFRILKSLMNESRFCYTHFLFVLRKIILLK